MDGFRPETWTISSNEALKISIIDEEDKAIQFKPLFTYPIYGDKEEIFGFKDLVIHLVFDSITMKPFLNIKCESILNDDVSIERDVKEKIMKFLPVDDIIYKDEIKWIDCFQDERSRYTLPDSKFKVDEYELKGEIFGVYKFKLNGYSDNKINKLFKRIQIFTLLFIEAATYINYEDEPNWELYVTFNMQNKKFIGFATSYKYWQYEGNETFDKDTRYKYNGKISQFLILPPYQHCGHGSLLYESLYKGWLKDDGIIEITVEDPNENFDDLRDRNDLKMLSREGFFQELYDKVDEKELLDTEWIDDKRLKYKIEKRQFDRIIEMILLHMGLVTNFERQVKMRIYLKNYESLMEFEDDEDKKNAIMQSFDLLKEDYERILSACEF
ncbi:hypothetical protein KAFR_0B01870 [Kazachstania africana CBS 2517]|uniref:Histone acetyltransferase type B catalytic subunit n=1 Tax=Kazachstania africana (strain ATCC 22294 / BCRC 22015 / CBS 2517 / CECT 1963 / NBRC 1671 / NRRL Y-8276) TaxID=1071382 RepID=H2AQ36_KAZAF|nr:hypothetical protein KAFR_0B01870 [Kazachstania africana CBS 2517]CCF56486.1 hypothetical protein KAFR_0B01870 [Kazachstania africana CBS 2517]